MVFKEPERHYNFRGDETQSVRRDLGALSVAQKMTDSQLAKVEEILSNRPEVYSGFGGGGWQRRLDTL